MFPTNLQVDRDLNFAGRVFMENAAGIAVASLGQIVEGYSVVFGRADRISLRNLGKGDRSDFLRFLRCARERVEGRFGPTVMFEHGASCAGTDVSCGVHRVHVHIVPYTGCSLKNQIAEQFRCAAATATIDQIWGELESWDIDRPYFWIEDGGVIYIFSYGEKRESQVLRRVIARQVGIAERWNWREYPTQEVAERVAKELSTGVAMPLHRLHAALV
jgi:diadenosine tetraphosphate (Ap4A) HIT family hydrolase